MKTPAFIVVRADVRDWDAYREYMKRTPRVVAKYGGRFIARGANPTTLEGEPEERRMVIVEFGSMDDAIAFYRSKDYQEVRAIRAGAASAQFVAIDGYPVSEWDMAVDESEKLAERAPDPSLPPE